MTNKNMYEAIEDIKGWDYYEKDGNSQIFSDFSNLNTHQLFIAKYLLRSEKPDIVNNFNDFRKSHFERAIHTNSVFFLGCLFYEKLNLKDKIKFEKEDDFYFIWFLTSLTHDFGYKVEKDGIEKYNDFTSDIESLNVTHNLLNYNENSSYLKEAYDTFSENTKKIIDYIDCYYYKRYKGEIGNPNKSKTERCKIDHGIYAGMKLYDGLVKNRTNQPYTSKLNFKKEVEKSYAIASFSIAIHNMRRNEISSDASELKFNINSEAFLFLFGLVDTLEPIKDSNDIEKLKNILIDFPDSETIILKNNLNGDKVSFCEYYKKIKDLESWLDLKVTYDDNSITITIK